MLAYPDFAATRPSLQYLVGVLTGREPVELRTALAHGWAVQGFLQGLIAPVGTVSAQSVSALCVSDVSGRVEALSASAMVDALNALSEAGDVEAETTKASDEATGRLKAQGFLSGLVGPALVAELAKLILPELTKWLHTWLEQGVAALQKLAEEYFKKDAPAPAPA